MILSFLTVNSVDKNGNAVGGLEQLSTSAGKLAGQLKKTFATVSSGYKEFKAMDESIRGSGTSFSDYIRYTSESEDATEAFGLATAYTKLRVIALNMALSAGIGLVVSYFSKKIIEAAQRVDKLAESSKEAADAATSTTSSLSELVDEYEKLGKKSDWDTDDMEQAQKIQDEILQLAKEQGTLDEDHTKRIDLQNGKYQEQLDLLRDITREQLKAAGEEYEDNADKQGRKLVKDGKKIIDTGVVVTDVKDHKMAKDLQTQGFDIFKDITPLGVTLGPKNINDADSIVEYYNQISEVLKYLKATYDKVDLESKGFYEGLYNILADQKDALEDQVKAYNEATASLKQNEMASDFATWSSTDDKKSGMNTLDSKIKATKEYQNAVKEAEETEKEWASQGFDKYGNVDNFHRDKIDWTDENLAKYKDFVDEQNSIFPGTIEKGSYSTVLGSWDTISDEDGTEHPFAFTPMLQTDNGLVPLTEDQLWNYIDTIAEQCYDENGKLDVDKLLQLDATGLDEDINGVMMRVKGMIAGIEGAKDPNGGVYSAADVLAQSGDSNEDIKNDLVDLYGPDADLTPVDDNGNLSRYVGKSMHDAQAVAQEGKDKIEGVYNQLYSDLQNEPSAETNTGDSAAVRYVDHIQSAFDILADSLGKDTKEMTISDVMGLTQNGVELTDEQASALDTLTAAANKYGTTIQGVAQAGEENGMFGNIENAVNGVAKAVQQMETISQNIDNIQSAYKACTTAMEEYNKYGYMSADALQGLLSMNDEYLACLDVVDGKLQINNERYADLIVAQYTEAEATAIEQAVNELNALQKEDAKEKTEDLTTATEDQQTALENAVPAIQNATTATGQLAIALATANSEAEGDADMQAKIDTITNALNTRLSAIHTNMQAAIKGGKDLKNQLNGFDKSKNSNSGSKSVTDVASAFDTLTKAMKEYNQYGYISADTMKSLMTLEDKFTSCLVQNGDKLEINANEFRKLVETQLKEEEASGKASKSADELKRMLSYLDENVHSSTISFEQLINVIKGYGAALDEAKERTDDFKSLWDNGKTITASLEKSRTGALDYDGTEAQSSALQTIQKYSKYDPDLFKNAYDQETGKIDLSGDVLKDAVVKSLEAQATAASAESGEAAAAIAKSYQTAADNIKEDVISVQDYFDGLGASIEEASSKIDDLQSAWNDIDDVIDEYNAYGGLSIDSLQKLLTMSPEYLACLQMNGDQLVFNEAAMKQLLIDQIRSRAEFLASKDETKDQAQILYAMIDAIEHDGINAIKGMGTEAERLQSIFSSIKDVFSSLLDLVNNSNDKKSNDLKIQGEAWIDVIDKRIDALNKANDAQERAIELQKAEDALAKAQANKTVRVYGENGYEWQADASAVRDAQSDLSDKRREYKKQDEIDRLNKLKDKIQENVNLIGSSWDDYQKKLAYTAQFEAMTYDQMVAHNDVFKDAVIANMKAVQAATNVSNIISKLETLIDVLTKLGNALGSFNGSTTSGGITGLFNRISRAFGTLTDKSSGKGFFGRLWDAGKSFLGIGSGTSKQIANEVASTVGNGVSNGMVEALGGAQVDAVKAANNIFSGEGGLFSVFTNGFSKLGQIVSKATGSNGVFGAIGKFFTGIGSKVTTSVLGTSGLKTVVTAALGKIPVIGPLLLGGTIALSAIGGGNIFKGISNVVTGIGKTLAKAVKGIGKGISKAAKGIGSMLSSVFHSVVGGTSSNGKKHKGIFGWKIWPWNWGKKASGDKSIKKSGAYNVDEKGEEIIVRQPQKGRVTTLEKGDGVIPANQTETLMGIAKNPIRWLRSNLAKVTGSTAVAVGATKDNADQKAVAQAQETAGKIDSVYSGAFSDIKKVSNAVMKSIKTGSGTVGKSIGSITGIMSGALAGFDTDKLLKSSNWLIHSIGMSISKLKDMLSGGSSITGSMDKLLSSSKSKTLAQLDAMKSSFEKTWNEMAEATGVSKDDITATSKEMYDQMTKLVNDTYAAIGDNTALNSEQVEQLTQTLFKSMQSTYTSGWNRIASMTDEMTEEQANKMATAYKSMSDGCTSTMNSISKTMASSWDKCGGGVRNLSAKTESTISKAWADTTGDTEKMLYDMRACFDDSWGQAKQGVRDLADNTASTINGAYTSIKSTSDETMNTKLPSDMANAWKNVEPGATNLSENIKWTMGQAYDNITKGCNDTVTSIKSAFGTAGNDLYNKGQTTDTAKTDTSKTNTSTTTKSSSSSGSSSSSSGVVSGGQSLPDWFKNSLLAGAKEDYEKAKDKVTSSKTYNYVKDKVTSSSAYQKASSIAKETKEKVSNAANTVKEKVSNSKVGKAVSSYIDKHKKKASGARKINESDIYNVDEQGSELMVRQPQAGRYTYLETGDGVVPADITSRLFEMGGNPDAWFQNQMSKYGAQITSTGSSNMNVSMGNIVIQNPVGSADDLAGEIVRELPNKLSQYMNLR